LYRGFPTFTQTNEYRQAVLAEAQVPEQDVLGIARALESDLLSDKFSYTLDLTLPVDPELDPIEDFILNKRKGHCQYFASALLVMLRQSGIPSRIVVGYRPTEFNRLGMYFPVKQKDAHAWVEALFSRQQLLGSDLERWLGEEDAYWVRFDPTPASDGEDVAIVEQQGQTIDYVDKLWKDYVVEGQKLTGENGLYAPVSNTSEDAYQSLVDRFNNLRQRFENGTLFSGGGIGFAWPIAIAITAIGFTAILLWRLLVALPKISPTLARRLGLIRDKGAIKQAFYARCLALLESRGFRRKLSETPQEFTGAAIAHLMPKSGIDALPLRDAAGLLTSIYYRLRYSQSEELTSADQAEIETALRTIERGVKSAHAKS
jgi:hypothetical protein